LKNSIFNQRVIINGQLLSFAWFYHMSHNFELLHISKYFVCQLLHKRLPMVTNPSFDRCDDQGGRNDLRFRQFATVMATPTEVAVMIAVMVQPPSTSPPL
jgi:hypothetical protein